MKIEFFGSKFNLDDGKLKLPFWVAQDENGAVYAYQSEPVFDIDTWTIPGDPFGCGVEYLGCNGAVNEHQEPSTMILKIEEPAPTPEPAPTREPWRVTEKFIMAQEYDNWEVVPFTSISKISIIGPTTVNELRTVRVEYAKFHQIEFKVQKPQDFIDKLP